MSKKNILILLAITALASFLRLYQLESLPPGLYPDEAMNGNNALEALRLSDYKVFYPENNGREGLFINIQSFFLWLVGENEPWVLRLPSAIFGILTVISIFFLTKELGYDKRTALLASFLLATSFWHINFSRIGFRAIMAPAFLTGGLFLLLKSFKSARKIWLPILAGTIYGLGFHSYIAYRATPALVLLVLIYYYLKAKKEKALKFFWKNAIIFSLATIAVAAPLALHFINNPEDFFGRTNQISIFNSPTPLKDLGANILKTAGMFNLAGDYNWRHNLSGKPQLFWPVGLLFIIGLLKAFIPEPANIFLLVFISVAALPVIISNEGIPHALRALLMVPPVIILTASGGVSLYDFLSKKIKASTRAILIFFAAIFLSLLIYEAYTSYFIEWGKNQNVAGAFSRNYVELGREINSLPMEMNKYIIVSAGGVGVRGIPMPAQTVMFITDSFSSVKQKERNIFYLLPKDWEKIKISDGFVAFIQ